MEGKRLPNAALHGHVRGERSRGRQRKRWLLEKILKREAHTIIYGIYGTTKNRGVWRNMGPSTKYVTLFLTNFDPLTPSVTFCHTSRNPLPLKYVTLWNTP